MDRFLIAPMSTGLQLNMPPWLIMDDAFTTLNNAYVWRSRLRKRFGAQYTGNAPASTQQIPLYSRLAINLTNTVQVNATAVSALRWCRISNDQPIPVPWKLRSWTVLSDRGIYTYTIGALGTPVVLTPSLGAVATVYTFNTTTGVYNFTNRWPRFRCCFPSQWYY